MGGLRPALAVAHTAFARRDGGEILDKPSSERHAPTLFVLPSDCRPQISLSLRQAPFGALSRGVAGSDSLSG